MSVSNRPKLGSHLEWHGQKIRVKVRVPPLVQQSAKLPSWLKEGLPTDSPRAAETLKWPVIARLKKRIDDARNGVVSGTEADPIVAEGMLWREAMAEDQPSGPSDVTARQAFEDRVDTIAHRHGEAKAEFLAGIALGTATPLESLVEDWIAEKAYKGRTEAARRHALKRFKDWSTEKKVPTTIEAVNRKIAGRFITDAFVTAGAHPATSTRPSPGFRPIGIGSASVATSKRV